MSTAELKIKLINEIAESNNEDLLKEVYRLLEIEEGDVLPYPLSDEQISMVHEAQADVKRGNFLNEEDANKETDEWLGR